MARSPDLQLARDWRARLDRFGQSDLTVAEFCHREGYSTTAFYQWRRKLRDSPPPAPPTFIPVDLTGEVIDLPEREPLRIELPGGAVVKLPAEANVEQQRDVINAIVRATCDGVSP